MQALEQAAILMTRQLTSRGALSLTAATTLSALSEGSVRLTALAAAAGISQPSMTELVHRLQRQGLVTRINDPEDGRAALVGITAAGRALMRDRRLDRRDRLDDLLTALSTQDEVTLTLAAHVSLPIIRQLIDNATNSAPR
ncbi:MarR family winged helix-turn-helix transcriptional regulator [Mycobacterium sp. URHB0021]